LKHGRGGLKHSRGGLKFLLPSVILKLTLFIIRPCIYSRLLRQLRSVWHDSVAVTVAWLAACLSGSGPIYKISYDLS